MDAGGSINPNSGTAGPSYSTALSGKLLNNASIPGSIVILGSGSSYGTFFFSSVSGPSLFGSGPTSLVASTSDTGAIFGFLYINGAAAVVVPSGHTLGTTLGAASSTFAGQTFASLGITPGTYVWTVGTNPNTDTITLNVGVPEHASLLVPAMAISALGLVQVRRRSRRA